MPTISFNITDDEAKCVADTTRMPAQEYLELQARTHVNNCVETQKAKKFTALGLPAQVASALPDDELQALADLRAAKVEAAKAATTTVTPA